MGLTYAAAHEAVLTSHIHAERMGIAISTAVVDAEGRLLAFGRMSTSRWISVEVAQTKAFTGALFGRASDGLSKLPSDLVVAVGKAHGRAVMAGPGVAVVSQDGAPVAFIGCSGGTGADDQACADIAAAGADAASGRRA